jgi:hypothetical protein
MSLVIVGATLLFLHGTGIIGWEPRPCEGCRVPSAVFDAISRDPVLLPLAGATNGAIEGEAWCVDSATQNGVTRTFKRTDRALKSLINDLSSRASRLGWKVTETPLADALLKAKTALAFTWYGEKRIAGATVQLSVFAFERGAIQANLYADCTEQ